MFSQLPDSVPLILFLQKAIHLLTLVQTMVISLEDNYGIDECLSANLAELKKILTDILTGIS